MDKPSIMTGLPKKTMAFSLAPRIPQSSFSQKNYVGVSLTNCTKISTLQVPKTLFSFYLVPRKSPSTFSKKGCFNWDNTHEVYMIIKTVSHSS